MKINDNYFSKNLSKIRKYLIILAILLAGCSLAGLSSVFMPVALIVIAAIVFVIFLKPKIRNDLQTYFKYPTSERLLAYYDRMFSIRSVEDNEVWLAYNKALVCSYYGEFEKALEFLKKIKWDNKIPYIQSLEISIRALINYLKPEDYQEGLRLSIVAQNMGQMSSKIPGSEKSKEFYQAYIEIGELLSGNVNEDIIRSLESKFDSSPFYPKVLIAWCLSNIYKKLDLTEKAEMMRNYCISKVPHCLPFIST